MINAVGSPHVEIMRNMCHYQSFSLERISSHVFQTLSSSCLPPLSLATPDLFLSLRTHFCMWVSLSLSQANLQGCQDVFPLLFLIIT